MHPAALGAQVFAACDLEFAARPTFAYATPMRAPFAFLAVILMPLPLAAQGDGQADAGPSTDDAGLEAPIPSVCGQNIDARGVCLGDVVVFCSRENRDGSDAAAPTVTVQCGALPGPGGTAAGRCVEIPGFGAWCAMPPSERCAFPGESGLLQMACADDEGALFGGCDLVAGCVDAPPCEPPAEETCEGKRLRLGCSAFGQPLLLGCDALGGSCDAGRCVGAVDGSPCGLDRIACDPTLTCVGASALGLGRCQEPDPVMEPVPVDAGPGALPPPPKCAALSVPSSSLSWSSAFALLLLVALGGGALRRGGARGTGRMTDEIRLFMPRASE